MGKYIFVLSSVLILVAFLNFSAVVAHPRAHPNHAQFDECKTAEKATDEDVKTLKDYSLPKTKAAKCVMTCLSEKSGKIVNGRLNSDGVVNWFKNSPDYTEQMQKTLIEIVDGCKGVTDTERCEAGFKMMECLMDGATKSGIKLPFKGPPPKN